MKRTIRLLSGPGLALTVAIATGSVMASPQLAERQAYTERALACNAAYVEEASYALPDAKIASASARAAMAAPAEVSQSEAATTEAEGVSAHNAKHAIGASLAALRVAPFAAAAHSVATHHKAPIAALGA